MSDDSPEFSLNTPPVPQSVNPILAAADVRSSVAYWQDVLGFPGKWFWQEPPTHGGVTWGEIHVQFTLNPELAARSAGQSLAINVTHVGELYAMHRERGAEIVWPLESKSWGMTEYSVRDNTGYLIRFGQRSSQREKSAPSLPGRIRILPRVPTPEEYNSLRRSVGWYGIDDPELVERALKAALFGVVAQDAETGEIVGSALLLGDSASFYYVKDVNVHPYWQRQRVGTALMSGLMAWAQKNAPEWSSVTLFTGEPLKEFYAQFGFAPSYGMGLTIHREKVNN